MQVQSLKGEKSSREGTCGVQVWVDAVVREGLSELTFEPMLERENESSRHLSWSVSGRWTARSKGLKTGACPLSSRDSKTAGKVGGSE